MVILGIILLILGLILHLAVLWWIGVVLLVIGLILMLMSASGRGSRHFW